MSNIDTSQKRLYLNAYLPAIQQSTGGYRSAPQAYVYHTVI